MAISGITPTQLNNITQVMINDFNTWYQNSLAESSNWVQPHMISKDTVKEALNAFFYGDVNRLNEVGDDSKYNFDEFDGYNLSMSPRNFEGGARVTKKEWVADDFSALPDQVLRIATKAALIDKYLAIDILNNGATTAWQTYDGVNLYDNNHQVGIGSFDNLLAGTGTFATDIETAYTAMEAFVTDLNIARDNNTPTHVVVPRQLRWAVMQELTSSGSTTDDKNSGVVNTHFGLVNPIVEPQLTDINDWFLFRSVPGEVPFMGVTNLAASPTNNQLVSENRPNSSGQIIDKDLRWVINLVKYLFPTHPHLHAKVVNA